MIRHHPSSRTPFVSRSRADATTLARARQGWVLLLDQAAVVGDRVAAGEELTKDQAVSFAALAIHQSAPAFPLPYASAGSAAAGFRELARGFVTSAEPELRKALAEAMAAAARCCRRMIQLDDAAAQAAFARRYAGGD